ncbi:MAG: DUF2252 family protein [Cyanobacteriota bacterium]
MMQSPFTFLRGGAIVMTADLATAIACSGIDSFYWIAINWWMWPSRLWGWGVSAPIVV